MQETARVIRVDRGEADCEVGQTVVRASMATQAQRVVVGDSVELQVDPPRINQVHPRRTALTRRAARGAFAEQCLAANMDAVAICQPCDRAFNARRLERELVMAWDSRALPIVALTKCDLMDERDLIRRIDAVKAIAGEAEVCEVSVNAGDAVAPLLGAVRRTGSRSVVLLGASGAGKSSLINALIGQEIQRVAEVRRGDAKGRHTTTAAAIVTTQEGLSIYDTAGIRALALWQHYAGLRMAFPELDAPFVCRYEDCRHLGEPGCGVLTAVETGSILPDRYDHWCKIRAELDAVSEEIEMRSRDTQRRS
jgi:ribosome biogenesis GTPase